MEDKITEFEHKLLRLVDNAIDKGLDFDPWVFITDLRKIMPPTCTLIERKFLDEVREKGEYEQNGSFYFYGKINMGYDGYINQAGFNANLKDLIEGD
jgi:hypothetical protein